MSLRAVAEIGSEAAITVSRSNSMAKRLQFRGSGLKARRVALATAETSVRPEACRAGWSTYARLRSSARWQRTAWPAT